MQVVDKYEYMGFELGEMVLFRGRKVEIIGFDVSSSDRSACVSDNKKGKFNLYENKDIYPNSWLFYDNIDVNKSYFWTDVENLNKLSTKSEVSVKARYDSGVNPLLEIRKSIGNETFKFEVYGESFCINLYETEVPITWDKKRGLELDCECCNVNLTTDMITDVKNVMQIIEDNLNWFKSYLGNKND